MKSLRVGSHGGNLWRVAEERGFLEQEILDFSADLNPWAEEWPLGLEWAEVLAGIRRYPEPTYRRFRNAAAQREGVHPDCILPGNGTADLIHLISRWRSGAQALIPVPTFTEYARAVQADGGSVQNWLLKWEDGFSTVGFEQVLENEGGLLLFLCNPNNPTGTLWPRRQLLECLDRCQRHGHTLVVDEAYMDFVEEGERFSLVGEVHRASCLIVLRSLTKLFGIPGIRAGYAVGSAEVVDSLLQFQPPWTLNSLAAQMGARLLQDSGACLNKIRPRLQEARSRLWDGLKALSFLQAFPSTANFILCRLTDPRLSAAALAQRLEERGILIRLCDDFEGLEEDRFIRVAVLKKDQNQRLLKAIQEAAPHAG